MSKRRESIIPYYRLMGELLACHHPYTDGHNMAVRNAAKEIVRLTLHGNEVEHDAIQEYAKGIKPPLPL